MQTKAKTENSPTSRGSRFAFTLSELLVVITVVSILAGLLLPALSHTKVSAKSIACANNLRQIGLALQMYVNDFGVYPLYESATGNPSHRPDGLWDTTLLSCGVGNRKLFQCPSWNWADAWGSGVPMSPQVDYSVNGFNFCYGYNAFGTRPPSDPVGLGLGGLDYPNTQPVPEPMVKQPSDMIAVGDYRGLMVYQANGLLDPWNYVNDQSPDYLRSRHPQGVNVTFCDSHVESLGRKKRWPMAWGDSGYAKRWNNDNQPHRETWPKPSTHLGP
jgi:prepilin-type N-terminal cleavage/methylation domain-containing protein/prepilin-type processing-associated H-X9-DG protein